MDSRGFDRMSSEVNSRDPRAPSSYRLSAAVRLRALAGGGGSCSYEPASPGRGGGGGGSCSAATTGAAATGSVGRGGGGGGSCSAATTGAATGSVGRGGGGGGSCSAATTGAATGSVGRGGGGGGSCSAATTGAATGSVGRGGGGGGSCSAATTGGRLRARSAGVAGAGAAARRPPRERLTGSRSDLSGEATIGGGSGLDRLARCHRSRRRRSSQPIVEENCIDVAFLKLLQLRQESGDLTGLGSDRLVPCSDNGIPLLELPVPLLDSRLGSECPLGPGSRTPFSAFLLHRFPPHGLAAFPNTPPGNRTWSRSPSNWWPRSSRTALPRASDCCRISIKSPKAKCRRWVVMGASAFWRSISLVPARVARTAGESRARVSRSGVARSGVARSGVARRSRAARTGIARGAGTGRSRVARSAGAA